MGIFRQMLEAEAGSLNTYNENTIRRIFVKAIVETVKNKDEALLTNIAASIYSDIQQMDITKDKTQETLALLHECLIQKNFSCPYSDGGEKVTLNNGQFKALARGTRLSPACISDNWFEIEDAPWHDLHPAIYSAAELSERDFVEFFSKGTLLVEKSTKSHTPDLFCIVDNVPENVKANPIANGIKDIKFNTEAEHSPWGYHVERYQLYQSRYNEHAQAYIALEELIHHELSELWSLEPTLTQTYIELSDIAMQFSDIDQKTKCSDLPDNYEAISLILRHPRNPWNKTKPEGETKEEAISKLLSMIKHRRSAIITLDKIAGENEHTDIATIVKFCVKAIEDIAFYNRYNGSLYVPMNTVTDDLPLPSLCKMISATLAYYEANDMNEEKESLLETIGYNLPIASWEHLVKHNLLSKDALDYLLSNTRYNEVTLYTNTPYHIKLICDFAEACEIHYPGSSSVFTDLDFEHYDEAFQKQLWASLNAEKLRSHELSAALNACENMEFLTPIAKI